MKKLLVLILVCLFSINLFSQTGTYILKHNKRKIPLFGFRFQSGGYLNLNADSTYNFETYWESFRDWGSGTWELYGDTLNLISSNNINYGGDVQKSFYSYSYSNIDTLKDKVIFMISEQRGGPIPGYNAYIFFNKSKNLIKFDLTGTYILNSGTFDSLIIKTDKYLHYKELMITQPVCCNENLFQITLGFKRYILDGNKMRNLDHKVILTKHKP